MMLHCHINPALQHHLLEVVETKADPTWRTDLTRCLPLLIDLLYDLHDQPTSRYVQAIRRVILEHCRGAERGQNPQAHEKAVARHVDLLVGALEVLRRTQLRHGEWSELPTPPQMFG